MEITVAICTWNRADALRATLQMMTKMMVPKEVSWELIVVNNGCTDHTRNVLKDFEIGLPIRSLFEPQIGLSHARNCAVRSAEGNYILWTDDDVDVDRNWLAEYTRAFDRNPDCCVFGGPIRPKFAGSPPAWLEKGWDIVADAYASRDFGDGQFLLEPGKLPYGANYALRLEEQRKRIYSPSIGRIGNFQSVGDETTLMEELLGTGGRGVWVPTAAVYHRIARERQTVKYLRNYYEGYGHFLTQTKDTGEARYFLGCPRWIWRQALTGELRYQICRAVSGPELWLRHLKTASTRRGQLKAYVAKRFGKAPR